jgi:hypothetical protein
LLQGALCKRTGRKDGKIKLKKMKESWGQQGMGMKKEKSKKQKRSELHIEKALFAADPINVCEVIETVNVILILLP